MSDQPRGRKRIAGRRPTRPGTPETGTPETGTPETGTPETGTPETGRPPIDVPAAESELEPATAVEEEVVEAEIVEDESEPRRSDGEKEAAGGRGGRSGRVLVGVLAALLVVTLGSGGVLGVQAWNGHKKEQGRDAAAGAAAKAAALVLSYDYRTLPQDFGAARETLTPDFQQKFDQTTKVVGEQATKTKATVKAEVREVSVSSSGADVVNVLLFVNQTTTSTVTQGKPRVDLNRARFTMVRGDGRWLVQEVAGL